MKNFRTLVWTGVLAYLLVQNQALDDAAKVLELQAPWIQSYQYEKAERVHPAYCQGKISMPPNKFDNAYVVQPREQ